MDRNYFEEKRAKAREIYDANRIIYNPYFQGDIILNSEGFHHLQYSTGLERNKEEQVLKFTLLPLGLYILKTATTIQEYRRLLSPMGDPARRDGAITMKLVEWWGFIAILNDYEKQIRVVTRRIEGGDIHFWSVMPHSKLRNDKPQKLFTEGLEDH